MKNVKVKESYPFYVAEQFNQLDFWVYWRLTCDISTKIRQDLNDLLYVISMATIRQQLDKTKVKLNENYYRSGSAQNT